MAVGDAAAAVAAAGGTPAKEGAKGADGNDRRRHAAPNDGRGQGRSDKGGGRASAHRTLVARAAEAGGGGRARLR